MPHPLTANLNLIRAHFEQAREDISLGILALNALADLLDTMHTRKEAIKCQTGSTTLPSPTIAKPSESSERRRTNP